MLALFACLLTCIQSKMLNLQMLSELQLPARAAKGTENSYENKQTHLGQRVLTCFLLVFASLNFRSVVDFFFFFSRVAALSDHNWTDIRPPVHVINFAVIYLIHESACMV